MLGMLYMLGGSCVYIPHHSALFPSSPPQEPPMSTSVPAQVAPKLIPISESPEDACHHDDDDNDDHIPLLPDQASL